MTRAERREPDEIDPLRMLAEAEIEIAKNNEPLWRMVKPAPSCDLDAPNPPRYVVFPILSSLHSQSFVQEEDVVRSANASLQPPETYARPAARKP